MAGIPSKYAINSVACKLWGLVNRESPTEHILGIAIFNALKQLYDWPCRIYSEAEFRNFVTANNSQPIFVIVPQFGITGVGHVDFAIFAPHLSTDKPVVVVECDGHQFHNTPQQASEDRRRKRALELLGIPLLPFTGTDVVRESDVAERDIAEFVNKKVRAAAARQAARAQYLADLEELEYRRFGLP